MGHRDQVADRRTLSPIGALEVELMREAIITPPRGVTGFRNLVVIAPQNRIIPSQEHGY